MARKIKEEIPIPEGLVIGSMVRYYKDGWKTGLLDGWKNGRANILPIGGYKSGTKNHISVLGANVEPIETIGAS